MSTRVYVALDGVGCVVCVCRAFASYSAEFPGEPALNKDETRWLGTALIEKGAAVAAEEVVPAAACHIMLGFICARRVEIERKQKGVLRYSCSFCYNEAPTPKRCGGCSNRIYCGPTCQTWYRNLPTLSRLAAH